MGIEAARQINGPWLVEVEFPSSFSGTIIPQSPDEIVDSIQVLTPPIPCYGAVVGNGLPTGLIIKGANSLGSIHLPVFEWTGAEISTSSCRPYRNQHYFALEKKLGGVEYRTPRITIGKVALLDDIVVCAMPVKKNALSRHQTGETAVTSQSTIKESIALSVFNILNGASEHEGTYLDLKRSFERSQIRKKAAVTRLLIAATKVRRLDASNE